MFRLSLNEYKNHLWPPNARFYIIVGVVAQTKHRNSESANNQRITNKTKYNNMYEYIDLYIYSFRIILNSPNNSRIWEEKNSP
jgi:hypothetical protein